MQIYELRKGTIYHSKFLNAISQIDRWELLTKELEGLKKTKEHVISHKLLLQLMKKYDVSNISDIENIIKDELNLREVFGEKSIIATDVNNFGYYIMCEELEKETFKNKDKFEIFKENYILSSLSKDEFERLGKNE